MQATMIYGPRDIRFEDRPEPTILQPTDAVLRLSATCICGSDLWPYRGIAEVSKPTPMGHEYCGIVEEVGKEVRKSGLDSSSSAPLRHLTTLALSVRTVISLRASNASS